MTNSGSRVVVLGASSLLGKELLAVLDERQFPVSDLKTVDDERLEPDLPIVDLDLPPDAVKGSAAEEVPADFDFAFVAAPDDRLVGSLQRAVGEPRAASGSGNVIDLASSIARDEHSAVRIPFLDHLRARGGVPNAADAPFLVASPSTPAIVISALMVRLAARFPVQSAIAQVFSPASDLGPRAIEELQKQTASLLSFQKVPHEVFGAQIAFNLLPRLATKAGGANRLEDRVHSQVQRYLEGSGLVPAVRVVQVPVFYSTAVSLYVETAERIVPAELVGALEGRPLRLSRGSEMPPTQVDVAGSSEILVDAVQPDPSHRSGFWLWAVADNLRLAAVNAVEIAEGLDQVRQPRTLLQ